MSPEIFKRPGDVPLDDLPADTNCLDRASLTKYTRCGFTISCTHTRPWGKGVQVTTPCCQANHRSARSGDLLNCRRCGWWYRVFFDGITTRWVSAGHGKS